MDFSILLQMCVKTCLLDSKKSQIKFSNHTLCISYFGKINFNLNNILSDQSWRFKYIQINIQKLLKSPDSSLDYFLYRTYFFLNILIYEKRQINGLHNRYIIRLFLISSFPVNKHSTSKQCRNIQHKYCVTVTVCNQQFRFKVIQFALYVYAGLLICWC